MPMKNRANTLTRIIEIKFWLFFISSLGAADDLYLLMSRVLSSDEVTYVVLKYIILVIQLEIIV